MIDGKSLTQSQGPGWGSKLTTVAGRLPRGSAACRSGLTLIELLVVMGVIGILLLMAVPSLALLAPQYMVGSSARALDSMMQNARLMAGNTQKPIRVVLDCREASQTAGDGSVCTMRLYTANFTNAGELDMADPWTELRMMHRLVSNKVAVTHATPAMVAADNPDKVYWAVFLPTGKASTSHNPLRLRFKVASGTGITREVGVSRVSGRVTVRTL